MCHNPSNKWIHNTASKSEYSKENQVTIIERGNNGFKRFTTLRQTDF